MSRNEKMKFIRLIEGSYLCITDALAKYDVPRSTYYRWKRKLKSQGIGGLKDNEPYRARTWNQLLPWQLEKIMRRQFRWGLTLSCMQCHIRNKNKKMGLIPICLA